MKRSIIKSLLASTLLITSILASSTAVFAAEADTSITTPVSQAVQKTDGLIQPNIIETVGVNAVTYYWVTQTDINNARNQSGWICSAVASAISSIFKNPLGIGTATYFGSQIGGYLGDVIASNMETGYYYHLSNQTYKWVGGSTFMWQYGGESIENETTGHWYFRNATPPPNMYAYGLSL